MKNLIKNYVFAIKAQHEKEEEVCRVLQSINSENQLFQLVCNQYNDAVQSLVHNLIGDKGVDWLGWWIYETEYGTKNAYAEDSTGRVQLDTFDKLWDFVILNKTAEKMNNG